jgi:uroporphyrin-III C-methyltransferase
VTTEPLSDSRDSKLDPAPAAPGSGPRPGAPVGWIAWLAIAGLLVAVVTALYATTQLAALKRESAGRLNTLQQLATNAADMATRAEAEARAARHQSALLETRLAEEMGQREGLEQLFAELSRGSDEVVMVEVERLIMLAAQELQIGGNIATALAALQTADSRLARADSARFVPLRRVLAADIERLKSAPTVDTTGIALKLDQLSSSVDQWPLLADGAPPPAAPAEPISPTAQPPSTHWWERVVGVLQRELAEHADLLRIRRVDTPEALLLSAHQQQLLRQQIKLRLLSARYALLARNDRLYRSDLAQAEELIKRYVDTRQPQAAAALTLIKQLAAAQLSVDTPQIGESLAAVRLVRTVPAR